MRVRFLSAILCASVGILFVASPSVAADKYQSSVIGAYAGTTTFTFTKQKSKIKIQPRDKAGDGGVRLQLNLKFVDCPSIGNDKDKAGKCGVKGSPVHNHVLEFSVNALGVDLEGVAGLPYYIEKGKGRFEATGKNKIYGSDLGSFISLIFGQPLGIGQLKLRTPGSNPSECDTIPLGPPGTNGCTDGDVYALTGINVGSDPDLTCSVDTDCSSTAICSGSVCISESCVIDADCDEGGGSGTGECGSDGFCCDPGLDPTCAGQV